MSPNPFINLKRNTLEKYFSKLNDMQQEAVFHTDGPLLVLAGAGSGKTTVIINRIENLIQFGSAYYDDSYQGSQYDIDVLTKFLNGEDVDLLELRDSVAVRPIRPWNILVITFTNKAANELKNRLETNLGEDGRNVTAATFHSVCIRILRRDIDRLGFDKSFTIYDSDDSQRMIKSVLAELELTEKQFAPKVILSEISRAKDNLISPNDLLNEAGDDYRKKTIARVYARYQMRMKEADALDFDDIIVYTVMLFQQFPEILEFYQNKYKYIMVDEYQDTNHVQLKLITLLSKAHNNICVVGDDDQSIYKFRGADIENILNFEKQFDNCKVIRLEQNYRSTKTILNAANSVIKNNNSRKQKALWTHGDEGSKIFWYKATDERDEAQFVAEEVLKNYKTSQQYSNNAVLYRMNAQSNSIENALIKSGIPYKIYGGMRFYDRKEIKDITAYLSVINNPYDMIRLKRIINEPKRGIGDATVSLLEEVCHDIDLSPIEIMMNASEYPPLSKKATALKNVATMFLELTEKLNSTSLEDMIDEVLNRTGYLAYMNSLGDEGQGRLENIEELKSNIIQYSKETQSPSLSEFLEEVALYSEADRDNSTDDRMTLMTIHSAKGLEYDNVFLVGMEEGIFPGYRSLDSEENLEEERRLAYVAITRAKNKLYISNANFRMLYGQTQQNITSRFVKEISMDYITKKDNNIKAKTSYKDDKGISAIHSSTLQQQLARNKAKSPVLNSSNSFEIGDKVEHNIFGEGIVTSSTKISNDFMLEIDFSKVGKKKIMANFAKIKKI